MTKVEAEAELRRMMLADRPPQPGDEITFATAADLMLRELEEIGRKQTTLANYRQILKCRLLPRFGEIPLGRIRRSQLSRQGRVPGHDRRGRRRRATVSARSTGRSSSPRR
jgi:integrase-like protein